MKKLCLFTIFLFFVCVSNAQTEFSVPTPSAEQKYNLTRDVLYSNILALITIAKSDGMTAEELGKKVGEKWPWHESSTFEQLVNVTLKRWACMSDSVNIIEQSSEKVVIIVPHIDPELEEQFLFGSLGDLIAFWDARWGEIANSLGLSFDLKGGEEGLKIEISQ